MKFSILMLSVAGAAFVVAPGPVLAQSWGEHGPVFESDIKRRQEKLEAERAERRKTYGTVVYPKFMQGGERPDIKPAAPPVVYFDQNEEPGSIIIDTEARRLYYVLPGKKAYRYPISVGREGFTWTGTERISRIASWPSWTPPPEMHKRVPGLPLTVTGGLKNPQGARALYLGSTVYRIHGTNNDRTVGRANSSGCFRLANEHVVHLASIAKVGTKVRVLKSYGGSVSESVPLTNVFGFFGSSDEEADQGASAKAKAKSKRRTASAKSKQAAMKPTVAPASAPAPIKKAASAE
ncbi:MAG: L,D-transpeptidase [Hyphomicrobiaceae bacterium]|nr:L,D-transpeptidase [Hyphomicrobiaceae bacterium]